MFSFRKHAAAALILALGGLIFNGCGGAPEPAAGKKDPLEQAEGDLKKLELIQDELIETQAQLSRDLELLNRRIELVRDMLLEVQSSAVVAGQQLPRADAEPARTPVAQADTEQQPPAATEKTAAAPAEKRTGLPLYADIFLILAMIAVILVFLKIGSDRQREIDESESGEVVITSSSAGASASVGETPAIQADAPEASDESPTQKMDVPENTGDANPDKT